MEYTRISHNLSLLLIYYTFFTYYFYLPGKDLPFSFHEAGCPTYSLGFCWANPFYLVDWMLQYHWNATSSVHFQLLSYSANVGSQA